MGKSINGKELGRGITQRKSDGLYQGRFTNRFGKVVTLYDKTYRGIREQLQKAQCEDSKALNVVSKDVTLDEWYKVWMDTCKKNCRDSTKQTYANHYKRIQKELGYRKLTALTLVILQQEFNKLDSDNERKNSKKILVDMLEKAIASDLLVKNVAKQINPIISKEKKKKRRVLTVEETKWFLSAANGSFYADLYILALETGMRVGELMGLMWRDVDFDKKMIHISRTLCYFSCEGNYIFEVHPPKTENSERIIPMSNRAYEALKRQRVQRQKILLKNSDTAEEYKDLVFVTRNNKPTQQFILQECMDVVSKKIQQEHPEFERISPHTFRHSFATRAIENGVQPKTLQILLGHASLQTTMDRYCHVTDDTTVAAIKLMEQKSVI